jgi:uncharacterized membrane protein YhaH (DUF805 family)
MGGLLMQFDWKRLFLTADGRIGRQEYWIAFLIMLGVSVVLKFIPFLGPLLSLALIYPQVCVGSKRLHDFGKSGFLMLVPYGVVVVALILVLVFGGMALISGAFSGNNGAAVGAGLAGLGVAAGLMGLAVLACLGFIVWVGVMPTQPGENRYGPEPVVVPLPTTPTTPV